MEFIGQPPVTWSCACAASAGDRSDDAARAEDLDVGGRHAESALRALRWLGRYLVIGFAAGSIPSLPLNQMLLNNRTVIGVDWGAWTTRDRAGAATLNRELVGLLDEGRLHPTEPTTYPLDRVAEALAALAARQVTGKLVLTP